MSPAQRAALEQAVLQAWRTRGAWAHMLRPLTWLYSAGVAVRRCLYAAGIRRSIRLPVKVIVVGNLLVGGAGKTPMVMALVEVLTRSGWRVGVISRGYGRTLDSVCEVDPHGSAQQVGDEPLLIRRRSNVPVVVGRDRVMAAQHLLQKHPHVNVIVSDDGLQHLALERDVQIVVFDERGLGNGLTLPAGPLREPMPRQCPARTLVFYNATQACTPWPGHLGRRRLSGVVRWHDWVAGHRAQPKALEALAQSSQHAPIWAAAGIAQPERFFDLLRHEGFRIHPLPLPDHFDFAGTLPWPSHVQRVLVTEKDAIKLHAPAVGSTEVWVAPLDLEVDSSFIDALRQLMPAPYTHTPWTPDYLNS